MFRMVADPRVPTRVALPSRDDPLIGAMSEPLGGPAGARVRPVSRWWSPVRIALAVACAVMGLGVIADALCHSDGWVERDRDTWVELCYSDVPFLYRERGLDEGSVPYRDTALEYPVLTGAVMYGTAIAAKAVAGITDADAPDVTLAEGVRFYEITAVLMAALALVVVVATARTVPRRPWDGMLVAASPVLLLSAVINWDLLAVACMSLAILAWTRERPALAGLLIGLGAAAKLYPILLLGPILLVAMRSRRRREAFGKATQATGAAAVTWAAVNVPVYLSAPDGWLAFWEFNRDRGAEFGSLWLAIDLLAPGVLPARIDLLVIGAALLAVVAIVAVSRMAPEPARLAQLAFLAVAAFVLVNKVWSPQYALWLLPLAVLARPRWRDILIWQVAEVLYFVAVWWYLGSVLTGTGYAYAIGIHAAGLVYLIVMVVRDMLQPEHDPVRPYESPVGQATVIHEAVRYGAR
jgi:uncharacterized membrane protein